MKDYSKKNWTEFREEIIEVDGGICCDCGRGEPDVFLQVHHKRYIHGKKPWEYSYKDCITLCKGCHAARHGIVRPKIGWEYIGQEDLGDLIGNCDLCGSGLRHQFIVFHQNWGTITVGTYCCDSLTSTEIASNYIDSKKRYEDRKKRFISSKRWKIERENYSIKQSKIMVSIIPNNLGYKIMMDDIIGNQTYITLDDAKSKVFEVIENGKASEYLSKYRS